MSGEVVVGTELPELAHTATLAGSVAYAGASGDHNPLHYDPDFAERVSPTGAPIAHGMLAMGLAARLLAAFAGGPEKVLEVKVRFPRPWPLGTATTFGGRVTAVEGGVATVTLWGDNEDGSRILRGTGLIVL